MAHQILRLPAVKAITGKSRTGIYADMKKGTFPKPIYISERSVGWLSDAIQNWIEERAKLQCAA
jgi:prophage regulatory protein